MGIADKIQPIPLLLAEQAEDMELRRGYQLGIYTLLEQVGKGGEAVVWSGFDTVRQRLVAIKIITIDGSDPAIASMMPANFEREVHLVASLEHPHILPIYEFGMADTFSYFIMKYQCFGTLADVIRSGPLPLEEVGRLSQQICSALAYLHSRGIIHRDIKPSNVLLDSELRPYLADFGLAKKLSQSTMVLHTGRGTGPYAPYEQQAFHSITPQSDIYSLGIVIYEMLVGKLPWSGTENLALLQNQNGLELPDPRDENIDCPEALTAVLRKFTAFQWQDRPQTAEAAFQLLFDALPAAVQQEIGPSLVAAPQLEQTLLAQDAAYLASIYQSSESAPETIRLTHFAFLDAYYGRYPEQQTEPIQLFLLQGALLHDYHVAEWWEQVSDPALRWQVCSQVLDSQDEDAIIRVLALLLRHTHGGALAIGQTPASLEKLIDLAAHSAEWRVRRDSLHALQKLLPQAPGWQPVGISEKGDVQLAQLALEKSAQARRAVEILAVLQSETAVHALLDFYTAGNQLQVLPVLQQLQQQAGSLPRWVSPTIRLRLGGQRIKDSLLTDGEGLSLPRALIGLTAGLLVSLLLLMGYFSQTAHQLQDSLLLPYPVSDIVTIVEVDDSSLAAYGRWDQWPRSLHARLVEQLHLAGARTVVFDFVFDAETANDQQLAAAIAAAGNVVQPILTQGDAYHDLEGVLRFEGLILPQPNLLAASAGLGHTSILHDSDGYIRRVPTVVSAAGQTYDSVAFTALRHYLGSPLNETAAVENGRLSIVGREIPVDDHGEMRVYYAGPPAQPDQQTFNQVRYQDVLAGTVPEELLRNKIVLVGITATAEPDRYLTPVSDGRPMYGVEILANVIEAIWSRQFIQTPQTAVRLLLVVMLGILVGFVAVRPITGFILSLVLTGLYYLAAGWIFDTVGLMLDLFYPFLAIGLSYLMVTAYRYSIEVQRRREILNLFASSVTPAVAQATIDAVREGKINLKGQEQEITLLLVEMRGQHAFAARQDPTDVLAMLTLFRNLVVEAILAFDGTVILSEQGQTMAVFNAPLSQADHVWRAVRAAQNVVADVAAYQNTLPEDHGHRTISFACVVDSGLAIVGYEEAGGQHSFTVLGELVTVANQIVSAADDGQILLGDQANAALADDVNSYPLTPALRLKGRVGPIPVHVIKPPEFKVVEKP